jgi:Tol biopolymer transport system component
MGFVTGLVLAALPTAAWATSIAGPDGKIVFASGRPSKGIPAPEGDKQARIWVADYPSGTPVQVTTEPSGKEIQHRHPNWSPDHTRIVYAAGKAFSGEYALWIVDLRTGEQKEFVPTAKGQDRPTWSPDGTRIAYGHEGDLWVKGVAPGSEAVDITNTPGVTEERAVWSPDGNTLYYNVGPAENRDIWMKSPVTPAGKETGILTESGKEKDDWQPAVSPDGTRLCFLRGQQNSTADIYTVPLDGSSPPAPLAAVNGTGELNCVWSPDGKKILYTFGIFEAGEIFQRDVNGEHPEPLNAFNVESHFDGNADWATNFSPKCDQKNVSVGVNGFVTVALSCIDPDAGFGAEPPTPTPLEDDALEIASAPKHGALGGLSNGKVVYTPGKDFKGTDTFTYTGSDGTSDAPPATVTVQVGVGGGGGQDKTPPAISNIKVSNKLWRVGKKLATISVLPVGTTISFRLSEAASTTLSFQRATPGRRSGKSCVKQTAQNRSKKACTRYVNAGSLKPLGAKAGQNKVRFQGRLNKSRSLKPGGYRLVVGAADAAGNHSQANGPTFTIAAG